MFYKKLKNVPTFIKNQWKTSYPSISLAYLNSTQLKITHVLIRYIHTYVDIPYMYTFVNITNTKTNFNFKDKN